MDSSRRWGRRCARTGNGDRGLGKMVSADDKGEPSEEPEPKKGGAERVRGSASHLREERAAVVIGEPVMLSPPYTLYMYS